jgi:hypothetical protein
MPHHQNKWNNFSIIIPFHHRHDLLFSLLDSLQDIPILVVDDGIQPTIFPEGVSNIRGKKRGFATAVNSGLKQLQEQGIQRALILNDDAKITPKDIEEMLNNCSEKTILSPIISCNERDIYGVNVDSWGRVIANFDKDSAVPAVYGTCMMLPTDLRFDEGFKHGFEDIELCLRMRNKGYQIKILKTIYCQHIGGASMSVLDDQGQRFATYGQLRLFGSLRKAPIISILSVMQILSERGCRRRYFGFAKGIIDWIYNDVPSLAARMASSKAGSSKAK